MLNQWRTLQYHDPAEILRRLRVLEIELADMEMDPKVRSLRTPSLNKYREWRDAAVFTYGMGLAKAVEMRYAREERSDYDFVTTWVEDTTQSFCAVQLKELVPEDLNPTASLGGLIGSLGKYAAKSDTALAIKLNRVSDLELLARPDIPFSQLWFFWATTPGSAGWCLYGDALRSDIGYFSFDYPTGPPKAIYGPDGEPLSLD